jgi:hypothetical protein
MKSFFTKKNTTLNTDKTTNKKRGVAIFIAVVTVSALMLIALAISDIAYKEQVISASGRDSRIAFFAADSGVECALFHDLKGSTDGLFAFARPNGVAQVGTISCGETNLEPDVTFDGSRAITTFYFNVSNTPKACSVVRVVKVPAADGAINTLIESRGYNNHCVITDPTPSNPLVEDGPRNLERSIQVTY